MARPRTHLDALTLLESLNRWCRTCMGRNGASHLQNKTPHPPLSAASKHTLILEMVRASLLLVVGKL